MKTSAQNYREMIAGTYVEPGHDVALSKTSVVLFRYKSDPEGVWREATELDVKFCKDNPDSGEWRQLWAET